MKKSIKFQKEPKITIKDVLSAVNELSGNIDQRFDKVEQELGNVENRLGNVETRLSSVEIDLKDVRNTVKTQMVTKDYLDEKFDKFELTQNKKYQKINTLAIILQKKKIITATDAKMVTAI